VPGNHVHYLRDGSAVGVDAQVTEACALERRGLGGGLRSGHLQVSLRLAGERVAGLRPAQPLSAKRDPAR
jgi:hypothetical protein